MDILDIDEALKDDSFIFLEDKTHDDVSNILQQWKSNNLLPTTTMQQQQQQQQPQEQVYKLNSRTFTRPKRKSAQNLESQFSNIAYTNVAPQQQQKNTNTPILNLEIGGLVTTMQKSFLQDTSPPSSICSSMEVSIERMNNSLITSADFSNINFLQSTQSLDFNGGFNLNEKTTSDGYTLSDMIRDRKALESLTMSGDDATLAKDSHIAQIDDISLTLCRTASGCSTMDNSTESMETNNRTVELANCKEPTYNGVHTELVGGSNSDGCFTAGGDASRGVGLLPQTVLLSDEMIGDTTFNLVENSIYAAPPIAEQHIAAEQPAAELESVVVANTTTNLNVTHDVCSNGTEQLTGNETFKKPTPLDETMMCVSDDKENCTFDQLEQTPNTRCETPESNLDRNAAAMKCYESTPLTTNVRRNKQQYNSSIKIAEDVNISPIVAPSEQANTTRVLNETFEHEQHHAKPTKVNSDTFRGVLPKLDSMEMLEDIENPHETFDGCYEPQHSQQHPTAADIEMQNIMDLAEAEAELLAGNENEEEFEHMLNELSKIELNAEQLKMKKSLDSIKKRFNHGMHAEREISREAKDMREMIRNSAELPSEDGESSTSSGKLSNPAESRNEELRRLRESLRDTRNTTNSEQKHSMLNSRETIREMRDSSAANGIISSTMSGSNNSSASGGAERLLSRRSRLYDDINMSTFSTSASSKSSMGTSFVVQRHDSGLDVENSNFGAVLARAANEMKETEHGVAEEAKTEPALQDTHNTQEATTMPADDANAYKLSEKRERDRDRFKTIKIIKQRNDNSNGENELRTELNVPCIDDDDDLSVSDDIASASATQRYSRRDHTSPAKAIFHNEKHEMETPEENASTAEGKNRLKSKINTNYLTYKKPKDKQLLNRNLPEAAEIPAVQEVANTKARTEARSLSRPRYISGLQKFTAVSKATSAGDLDNSNKLINLSLVPDPSAQKTSKLSAQFNRTQPAVGGSSNAIASTRDASKPNSDLKSPMGIKSKSFHNLSNNFGYGSVNSGLKKPSNVSALDKHTKVNSLRTNATTGQIAQSSVADAAFKVPKLVSGLRAPGKRAGLVRPSSGYYSLSVAAKNTTPMNDTDSDTGGGRHSPTDSMSSASSRGSLQSANIKPLNNGQTTQNAMMTTTTTMITIGSTGIPKPSGLRPPTIKRSGLPKPSSIVKR